MGGLGNQMFQISKAVSESLEHGLQPEFLKDAFIPMHGNQPTNYLTNIFRNIKFVDFNVSKKVIDSGTVSKMKVSK